MFETSEKTMEKEKINKNNEIKNREIQRNEEKKTTLNLSEFPNIINDETQYYGESKNNISSNFPLDYHTMTNGFLNPVKLKNSFINEPISHNKIESRSSLGEIQVLLKTVIKENQNKSIGKKERKQKNHTNRRKNSSIDPAVKKMKEKDINKYKEELIINGNIKKKYQSSKKKVYNIDYSDEEQKVEKSKKGKIKFRKSEIIRPFKKDGMVVGDVDNNKKGMKRKSLFSLQARSPEKIYINEIYINFLQTKIKWNLKMKKEMKIKYI